MIAIGPLVGQTIQTPEQAAKQFLALDLPREAIWVGFALVQILNTLNFVLRAIVTPLPSEFEWMVSPVEHLIMNSVLQFGLAVSVTFAGRWLNGRGGFLPVLSCQVWINFVQLIAMAGLTVVAVATPTLANILDYVVAIFAIYISLHFINQVHQLGSLWRSFGVFLLSGVVMAVAIALVGQSLLPSI